MSVKPTGHDRGKVQGLGATERSRSWRAGCAPKAAGLVLAWRKTGERGERIALRYSEMPGISPRIGRCPALQLMRFAKASDQSRIDGIALRAQ